MPSTPISFNTADAITPEGHIFNVIMTALQFEQFKAFLSACVFNIFAAATLTAAQKNAILYVTAVAENGSPENVNSLLQFILYGSFDTLGVEAETLAPEAREGILLIVYSTAKAIVQTKAEALAASAGWEYQVPDYKIEAE